jgi:hypothetical protein
MRGKSGISAIVVTVLIILITVAAISIIWTAVIPMINRNVEFDALEGRVSVVTSRGYTVYDEERGIAIVQVKRDDDDSDMSRIRIIFSINGSSESSVVIAPEPGNSKTYSFDLSSYGEPDSVSVSPIFIRGSGAEKEGGISSSVSFPTGSISDVGDVVLEVGREYFSYGLSFSTDGLVAYWPLDGDFDDLVGGNDGSCTGSTCPYFADGAMSFDGMDDHVSLTSSIVLGNGGWTVTSLVKTLTPGTVLSNSLSGPVTNVMSIEDDVIRYRNYDGTGWKVHSGGVAVNDDAWHLLTWVNYDNQTMDMYIDGVLDVGNFNSFTNNGGPVNSIGSSWDIKFKGQIDNVMIYNRALSQEEVSSIYEVQRK